MKLLGFFFINFHYKKQEISYKIDVESEKKAEVSRKRIHKSNLFNLFVLML